MFRSVRNFWYRLSLKNKFFLFFVLLMIIPNLMSMYNIFFVSQAMGESSSKLDNYFNVYQLKAEISEHKNFLQDYILREDEVALDKIRASEQKMDEILIELEKEVNNTEVYLIQKSIDFYYMSYLEESKRAVVLSQDPDPEIRYNNALIQALTIGGYLDGSIVDLIRIRLEEGNNYFSMLVDEVNKIKNFFISGNVLVIFLVLFFGLVFTNYLMKPIRQLATASNQIASGDFNINKIDVVSTDEVGVLTKNFIKMHKNIKQLVSDLNEKAKIEKRLHEQKLKNVEMQKLLNDAKYISLQSQINPHYLFNTLNMISRVSMFENADKTTKLIRSLATIFRYHLTDQSKAVTLRKEINIIKEYIFLQNERFSDRIKIDLVYDPKIPLDDIYIPCFTLQPLVENGVIHGLESLEEGGKLRIKLSFSGQQVRISIIDNGKGIEKTKLDRIITGENQDSSIGIGLNNVIYRLKLYFNRDCLTIRSKPGLGTKVEIIIPKVLDMKGERKDVQNTYR